MVKKRLESHALHAGQTGLLSHTSLSPTFFMQNHQHRLPYRINMQGRF